MQSDRVVIDREHHDWQRVSGCQRRLQGDLCASSHQDADAAQNEFPIALSVVFGVRRLDELECEVPACW